MKQQGCLSLSKSFEEMTKLIELGLNLSNNLLSDEGGNSIGDCL